MFEKKCGFSLLARVTNIFYNNVTDILGTCFVKVFIRAKKSFLFIGKTLEREVKPRG